MLGRALSALADLGTVFLVFLVGGDCMTIGSVYWPWLFLPRAVLQIQQSHFFTMDTFADLLLPSWRSIFSHAYRQTQACEAEGDRRQKHEPDPACE